MNKRVLLIVILIILLATNINFNEFHIGELIDVGNTKLIINSVDNVSKLQSGMNDKLDYYKANITFYNESNSIMTFQELSRFSLIDNLYQEHGLAYDGSLNDILSINLPPDFKVCEDIIFKVPKDRKIELIRFINKQGKDFKVFLDKKVFDQTEYYLNKKVKKYSSMKNNLLLTNQGTLKVNQIYSLTEEDLISQNNQYEKYLHKGRKFLVVSLTFKNATQKIIDLSFLEGSTLIHRESGSFYFKSYAFNTGNIISGYLDPTETITGEIMFQVPLDNNEFYLQVTNINNENEIEVIKLY